MLTIAAPSFNCLLPAHKCTQFSECNDYTGKCNCPEGFGGDDCLQPRAPTPHTPCALSQG